MGPIQIGCCIGGCMRKGSEYDRGLEVSPDLSRGQSILRTMECSPMICGSWMPRPMGPWFQIKLAPLNVWEMFLEHRQSSSCRLRNCTAIVQ